jgi:putative addiction module CopG family antidote
MVRMHLTLREEDRRFVERELRTGRYSTESEVISDALAEFRVREESRAARLNEIRAQVMVGLKQLDAGQGTKWDVEEAIEKGEALLASDHRK